jgi:putative ABC transport system ATP-binding protein/macrolide transport system ATP-binding/permease protein
MSANGNHPLYETVNVSKTFKRGSDPVYAVDGVSFAIDAGDFVALEGPSGSGKTTLLQLLGALDRPSGGRIVFDGRDLGALPDRELAALRLRAFGFVFQQFNLIPTLTALENVEAKLAPTGARRGDLTVRARELLGEVGLAERAGHLPGQLSGGEQQRLAVACGVVGAPALVVADEPTAELDTAAAERVLAAMEELAASGVGFVVSSHDPRVMAIADGFVRLDHGRVVAA